MSSSGKCWEEVTIVQASDPETGQGGISVEVLEQDKETVTAKITLYVKAQGQCVCIENPNDSYWLSPGSCNNAIHDRIFRATLYKEAEGSCPNISGSCDGSWGPKIIEKTFVKKFTKGIGWENRVIDGCSAFFTAGSVNNLARSIYLSFRTQLDFMRTRRCQKTEDEIENIFSILESTSEVADSDETTDDSTVVFESTAGGGTEAHPEIPPAANDCCILLNSVVADLNVETLHPVPIQNGQRRYRIYGDVVATAEKKCIPKTFVYNEFSDQSRAEQGPHWKCGNVVVPLNCEGGVWPENKRKDPFKPGEKRPKPENEVDFGFDFDCEPLPGLPTPPKLKLCGVEWEKCSEPCEEDPSNCTCTKVQTSSVDFEISFTNIIGDFAGLIRAVRRLLPGGPVNPVDASNLLDDLGGCATRFLDKMKDGMPEGVCGKKVNCGCEEIGEARDFGRPDKKPEFDPAGDLPTWVGVPEQGGSSSQPCDCDAF